MALLSWNVCGLHNDIGINEVKALLAAKRISIVGLNETKIKAHRQMEVMDKLGVGWKFATNSKCMVVGEWDLVWLGWDSTI